MKTINLTNLNDLIYKHNKLKEIESIQKFVELSKVYKVDNSFFDNYFYNFKLEQISAEFDLLKINSKSVLNIELKYQLPKGGLDQIHNQLIRLHSYLLTLNRRIFQYTYIASTDEFYHLDREKKLVRVRRDDFYSKVIPEFSNCECMKSDINILFNPDYYLVSPLVNVQYFLKKRYFLTENQAELKHNIIDCLKNNKMVSIVGDEKSGRTLLLFDLAMDLAKKNNIFFFLSDKEFDKQKRKYQLYPFKLFFKDSLFAAISSNDKKIDYIIIDNLDFLSNYEIETLYYFCLKNNSKVLVTMGSSVTNNNKSGIIKDIFNAMSINFYLKSN